MLVEKLKALGLDVAVDEAGKKMWQYNGNVRGFLKGNVPGTVRLFFEAQ